MKKKLNIFSYLVNVTKIIMSYHYTLTKIAKIYLHLVFRVEIGEQTVTKH